MFELVQYGKDLEVGGMVRGDVDMPVAVCPEQGSRDRNIAGVVDADGGDKVSEVGRQQVRRGREWEWE